MPNESNDLENSEGELLGKESSFDDPQQIFLHKRGLDDLKSTQKLHCDDKELASDVLSCDSNSVALSVVFDQDFGLIGSTSPPSVSPPAIPDLGTTEEVDYANPFYVSLDTSDNPSHVAITDGD